MGPSFEYRTPSHDSPTAIKLGSSRPQWGRSLAAAEVVAAVVAIVAILGPALDACTEKLPCTEASPAFVGSVRERPRAFFVWCSTAAAAAALTTKRGKPLRRGILASEGPTLILDGACWPWFAVLAHS
jgi:hypothetical protein